MALARVLQGVLPEGVLLVHYFDDFLPIFTDPMVRKRAGERAVEALTRAGFLISPNIVAVGPPTFFVG